MGRPSAVTVAALATTAFAALLSGCGGGDSPDATGDGNQLVVSAAASLGPAFTAYAEAAGIDAKQSFAGSDDLAAQIRQGVTPDVYAAANTSLPDELRNDGLVGKPVVFATNELVLAVPAGSPIDSVDDLTDPDVTVAIGQQGVPVGDYTREVLDRLPAAESDAILANVGTEEPDVAGIVGKLTQGAVDAGFVYVTDVVATEGALEAIDLPAGAQPKVAYGVAVVKGAENPAGARHFIDGLLDGRGADALADAGFGPRPGG
jgi:molybdate transport system substrate-binding protein